MYAAGTRQWSGWACSSEPAALDKKGYLRTAVKHELNRIRDKHAKRQAHEMRWAVDLLRSERHDSAADGCSQNRELDSVREGLAILTPRQREILALLILGQQAGWHVKDVANKLGIHPATIRRHRQNARETLTPFLTGKGSELHRSLRAAERVHEDFHRGKASPFGPRPVILDAWKLAKEWRLDPERGTEVVLLNPSELRQRREQSPIPKRSPILAELFDVAERNGMLAVVLDADSIVLHRGGHRTALAAADRVGYQEAVQWNLYNAGVNAAGLAQILGRPITVNRFEHTFLDQQRLCCRIPQGGHIILNLTTTTGTLTSMPSAIHRLLHTLALRLHQQLRTTPTK